MHEIDLGHFGRWYRLIRRCSVIVVDNEGLLYAACDDGSIRKFNVSYGALEYISSK